MAYKELSTYDRVMSIRIGSYLFDKLNKLAKKQDKPVSTVAKEIIEKELGDK